MAKAKSKSKSKATSLGAHCHPVEMSAADKKRQEEWAIEDDARTLQRAAEIRKDKGRLAKVKAWAKRRSEEIASIAKLGD